MNFNEFVESVKANILNHMPIEYRDSQVEIREIIKENEERVKNLVVKATGTNIYPAAPLEIAFENYLSDKDLERVLDELGVAIVKAYAAKDTGGLDLFDFNSVKERIICEVVGIRGNEKLIEESPHFLIDDLAILFRVQIDPIRSFLIKNDMAGYYNAGPDELYEEALNNAQREEIYEIKGIGEAFSEMGFIYPGVTDFDTTKGNEDMYVLSNKTGYRGSSCIAFPEFIEECENLLGEEFIMLPASLHEMIAIPMSKVEANGNYSEIVRSVNEAVVAKEDRLSENVYIYNPKERMVRALTNGGNSLNLDIKRAGSY